MARTPRAGWIKLSIVIVSCGLLGSACGARGATTASTTTLAVTTTAAPTASTTSATTTSVSTPTEGPATDAVALVLDQKPEAMVPPFNGSALVAHGDEILISNGYGFSDQANGLPNSPTTRFRIGSITKQFTAMAILILQSRDQLDVANTACSYLAGWETVTVHQLLSQMSGLADFTSLPDYETFKFDAATPEQSIGRVAGLPLIFAPGARYAYSNTNYIVLGMIVEAVSGKSYADFLQGNIFGPLGMINSGYENGDSGLAVGYGGEFEVADDIDMTTPFAAGGLYSTVEDMHRWARALATDELIPTDAMAAMMTPYGSTLDFPGFSYGYGVLVGHHKDQAKVWHDGGIDGFQAFFAWYPDLDISVVLLANRHDTPDLDIYEWSLTKAVLES